MSTYHAQGGVLGLSRKEDIGKSSFCSQLRMALAREGGAPQRVPVINEEGNAVTLPFDFVGGFVGYFGYEMKEETMPPRKPDEARGHHFRIPSAGSTPDAAFIYADRLVVFDHLDKSIYLTCLARRTGGVTEKDAREWIAEMSASILRLQVRTQQHSETAPDDNINRQPATSSATPSPHSTEPPPTCKLSHTKQTYIQNVHKSKSLIHDGETYEVCLTTQIRCNIPTSLQTAFTFYRHLRKRNPAPYAAFAKFGKEVTIASSSPERFLKCERDGCVSMKPIKGTVRRATVEDVGVEEVERENRRRVEGLRSNEKDRSENLMVGGNLSHQKLGCWDSRKILI